MHFKKIIIEQIYMFNFHRKSMGKLFYIPFLFNYLMIPLIVCVTSLKYDIKSDIVQGMLISFLQYFTPVLGTWWVLLVFIEIIDGKGNELYFVQCRNKLWDCLCLLNGYILFLILPFIVYSRVVQNVVVEFMRIIVECLFFVALIYFMIFLTTSIATAMTSVVVYHFFSIFGTDSLVTSFSCFDAHMASIELLSQKYASFLLFSIILLMLGRFLNLRYKKYH